MTRGRLAERVAVVTGAGQGVGRGIALALAAEGARIAVVDVNVETAQQTVDACRARGVDAVAVTADVGRREEVAAATDEVMQRFGSIAILVNNAHDFALGIPLEQTSDDDMERSWRTATLGTLYFMQACFVPMRDRGGGKILNIGSGGALDGDAGAASYVAAKEAVRALTRVAAREWGPHGIHVNTLCPFARTPRWEAFAAEHPGRVERQAAALPLRRAPGDPELDIGRAAVFLVSDDSSYVTGQTLFVEGGRMRT
ncbi:MAG: SDR family oxidoreductase [Actinobacteria bacterium]|nr:SDR family oxidoreductase [Actinomycetota bacterium]